MRVPEDAIVVESSQAIGIQLGQLAFFGELMKNIQLADTALADLILYQGISMPCVST